ncbi:metallophosphoesterase [Tautonia plasticadhaerens]|uniref:Serine/threonine-protein phosphatase 1 n=1 Tax=Tautonia plasticadhaerens TaxID=2527974 RepID=A0A518H463_9BACT|nr:metallophosphoesterase [Tautonia plasticadhaerens]QDV35619.1 Serine/threonine-protein phosphatase 1 [Tautonia plasticadhaerens]
MSDPTETARTIAIGDIHGCSLALDALIEAIRPAPEDTIVTLGDTINRGPDSRGFIERLIDLSRRCRLVPLLGNHDQMLLDVHAGKYPIFWLLDMGGTATLDSYGPGRELSLIPEGHIEFLEGCLDFYETDRLIFVHANYFPDIPMAEQHVGMLRWESLRDMTPGPHESGKVVIAGHTSQKGGEVLDLGHLKCIDTFCYGGGWLTALEVGTGEVWQADRGGGLRRR